jgi:hypothetical protein
MQRLRQDVVHVHAARRGSLELVRRGCTEPQIAKIWSGNLLGVMDEPSAPTPWNSRSGFHVC